MIVDDTDASLAAEPVALPVAAAASTEHVGRPATPQQYPHEATTPARSPAVTVDAAQPPNTPDHGSGSRADVFAQRRLRRCADHASEVDDVLRTVILCVLCEVCKMLPGLLPLAACQRDISGIRTSAEGHLNWKIDACARRRVARSDANERSPVQRSTRLNDVNKQVRLEM